MHLRVFLFANHFRLKIKKKRGHTMLEITGATSTTYVMIFGNRTHSKGDPDPAHLSFTKIHMWGRVARIPSSMHTKDHPAKKGEK